MKRIRPYSEISEASFAGRKDPIPSRRTKMIKSILRGAHMGMDTQSFCLWGDADLLLDRLIPVMGWIAYFCVLYW
jgi:hypothetical protein